MTRRAAVGIGIGLAALGAVALAVTVAAQGAWIWADGPGAMFAAMRSDGPPGRMPGVAGVGGQGGAMMGDYGGMMGRWTAAAPASGPGGSATTSADAVRAAERAIPPGAKVDPGAQTIAFTTADVRFTVVAGPGDGAEMSFRIAGLTNPTVRVPQGATVAVTVLNGDTAAPHNWVLVSGGPPYGAVPPAAAVAGATVPVLGAETSAGAASEVARFTAATAGVYHYVCGVPGHAAAGMYGTLQVTA